MSDWRNLPKSDINISLITLSEDINEREIGLNTLYDWAFKLEGVDIPVSFKFVRFYKPEYCEHVGVASLIISKDCI